MLKKTKAIQSGSARPCMKTCFVAAGGREGQKLGRTRYPCRRGRPKLGDAKKV